MVLKAYTERYNAHGMCIEISYLDAPTQVRKNQMEEIILFSLKEKMHSSFTHQWEYHIDSFCNLFYMVSAESLETTCGLLPIGIFMETVPIPAKQERIGNHELRNIMFDCRSESEVKHIFWEANVCDDVTFSSCLEQFSRMWFYEVKHLKTLF